LLAAIRRYRAANAPETSDYYDGLTYVVLGVRDWIARHAVEARAQAAREPDGTLRENLLQIAAMNERLVDTPPATFREACQWIAWYQMTARMYNGSGSLGRLDVLLWPYYERDTRLGILDDDEAIFDTACLLLRDTSYVQVGGPDVHGVSTILAKLAAGSRTEAVAIALQHHLAG
jgi:formate C-acetyltransferase